MWRDKYRRIQGAGRRSVIEGPIWNALLVVAMPMVMANMLRAAYHFIDAFWVGRLGGDAVAAVSVSFPIVFLLMTVGAGLAIAGSTLAAQYLGVGRRDMVGAIASQALLLALCASVILSVIGFALAPQLLQLFSVEPGIFADALAFLRYSILGLVSMFVFFVFESLMRGIGEVVLPLIIVFITVVLNFIFDPLFIFGWGFVPPMGVAGAAIATLTTQTIAALAGLAVLLGRRYGVRITWRGMRPQWSVIRRIFTLGYPASIEQATRSLGMNAMVFLAAGFGTTAVAAYGVGSNVLRFVFVPAMGLSFATAAMVGQNIGAGNNPRAKMIARLSAVISFGALSVAGAFAFFFAESIMSFFVPGDAEVIKVGADFIRILGPSFGLMGAQQALAGAFRGAGDTRSAMAAAIILQWALQLPLAFLLSRHTTLGLSGIWWAFPISFGLTALVTWWWFARGSWARKMLTESEQFAEYVSEEIIAEEGVR